MGRDGDVNNKGYATTARDLSYLYVIGLASRRVFTAHHVPHTRPKAKSCCVSRSSQRSILPHTLIA